MAVAQQPMPGVGPGGGNPLLVGTVGGHREWDTGILSCFTDCKSRMYMSSRKHAYIILTPLNPTFIHQN